MASYYIDGYYSDQNAINYYDTITPTYTTSQPLIQQYNYTNTINYILPSNQYVTNITPNLTETQNVFYTPQLTNQYNYLIQNNYNQNLTYNKEYQTGTANNTKAIYYPTQRYSSKTAANNIQQMQSPGRYIVNTIQRANTLVQKPNRKLLLKFDNEERNSLKNYRYSDASVYKNQLINNNKKVISKGNQQVVYNVNDNYLQTNNLDKEYNKQNIDEVKINKENDKTFDELINLTNANNNQTITEDIYNLDSYNNPQYGNTTKILVNDDYSSENISLMSKPRNMGVPFLSQSAHFPSRIPDIKNEFILDDNTSGNKNIKKETDKNIYVNNQNNNNVINGINIEGNQIINTNQSSDNINFNNYNSNNTFIDINEFFANNNNNPNTQIKKASTQYQSQPYSAFIKNINGEIISNNNSHHYYRRLDGKLIKSYGYCQHQGKRNYMEDEGKVIENLNGDSNKVLFGLFDGHGGGQVSKFLQENIGNYMKQILNLDETNYINNFTTLFRAIDKQIYTLNVPTVGSTGTIVYIEKKDNRKILYCANIGDSRCVLVNKNRVTRLSYDHRVADIKEKQRILDNHGVIVNNRVYGILMLSRSFGDFITKNFGVIVDPHVAKIELSDDDLYCIIASDGVWDVLKDEECSIISKMGLNSGELSKRIINEGLKRKSKDNLSCFVIHLN